MNFKFSHPCDDLLTNKLHIIGGQSYFLVCIGNVNYFHSLEQLIIEQVKGLLFLEKIVSQIITDKEMRRKLLSFQYDLLQMIRGNRMMLEKFLSNGNTGGFSISIKKSL